MTESAGARLKKIRLAKGISLEDVYKNTKIHAHILKALEGDGLTDLNPVYQKGFMKIYCNFLGVDPKDYILNYTEPHIPIIKKQSVPQQRSFKELSRQVLSSRRPVERKHHEQAAPVEKKPLVQSPLADVSAKASDILDAIVMKGKEFFDKLVNFCSRKDVQLGVIALVVSFLVITGVMKIAKGISHGMKARAERRAAVQVERKKEKPAKAPSKSTAPVAKKKTVVAAKEAAKEVWEEDPEPEPVPAPVKQPVVTETPKVAAPAGINLGIRTRENCWISLRVDGKVVFQRVLEKGRFESWAGKNKMELAIGNAGVVELEVNGQLYSNLGRKGQALKNIVITKEGLNIGR